MKMDDQIYTLTCKIEQLRGKLDTLIQSHPNDLTRDDVYKLSLELDRLIAGFMECKYSTKKQDKLCDKINPVTVTYRFEN